MNGVPIYDANSTSVNFNDEEFKPINLELVIIQLAISNILQSINSLKAANVNLFDVINYNYMVSPL